MDSFVTKKLCNCRVNVGLLLYIKEATFEIRRAQYIALSTGRDLVYGGGEGAFPPLLLDILYSFYWVGSFYIL